MPYSVSCDACKSSFALPDKLYDDKVRGHVVVMACKSCGAKIRIDGKKGTHETLKDKGSNASSASKEGASDKVQKAKANGAARAEPSADEKPAKKEEDKKQARLPMPSAAATSALKPKGAGSRVPMPTRPDTPLGKQSSPVTGAKGDTAPAATADDDDWGSPDSERPTWVKDPTANAAADTAKATADATKADDEESSAAVASGEARAKPEAVGSERTSDESTDKPKVDDREPKADEVVAKAETGEQASADHPEPAAEPEAAPPVSEQEAPEARVEAKARTQSKEEGAKGQRHEPMRNSGVPSVEVAQSVEETSRRKRPPLAPHEVEQLRNEGSSGGKVAALLVALVLAAGVGVYWAQRQPPSEPSVASDQGEKREQPATAFAHNEEPSGGAPRPPGDGAENEPNDSIEPVSGEATAEPASAGAPGAAEAENAAPEVEKKESPAVEQAAQPAPSGHEEAAEPPSKKAEPEPAPTVAPSGRNGAFDKVACLVAIQDVVTKARSCRRSSEQPGTAQAIVRFAPGGSVDYVRVADSVYQGTSTAACIEETIKGTATPAYVGEARAVRVSVELF